LRIDELGRVYWLLTSIFLDVQTKKEKKMENKTKYNKVTRFVGFGWAAYRLAETNRQVSLCKRTRKHITKTASSKNVYYLGNL
jgi:hypothetical protein